MFSEELKKYSWDDTTREILAMTTADVERALAKERLTDRDFMALISPAAEPYLETMARRSRAITEQRFGKTVSIFIPLYITNSCKAIKAMGPFENLLIVTGENPAVAGTDYIEKALQVCRPYFSNLTIEVMPLPAEDYERLTHSGLNGVICFQETYNRDRYKVYHPAGMKSKFEWRCDGFDRMGQAGVHKIGMGVLIGLEDWRTDVTMMARHLAYLRKTYWKTKYSVNFPRMRPSESGFQPNVVMSDRELAQLTFAFRIFDPDVDISYSTRENHQFRNNMATLGVTTMSAGSKTDPGGYATYPSSLEQFAISDPTGPLEVAADLRALGREPVWKDWDRIFD